MIDSLITIASFLAILTCLVFVHELGHYLAARWAGVQVEVFSVGFGPEIAGRTDRFGCRWRLSAIPLGGYVKMKGQADWPVAQSDTPPDSDSYLMKTVFQRLVIIVAGPAANVVFAIGLLAGVLWAYGQNEIAPIVGEVMPASPAEIGGLQTGDRILSIDGVQIKSFADIVAEVRPAAGQMLSFEIERDTPPSVLKLNVRAYDCILSAGDGGPTSGSNYGKIGVSGHIQHKTLGPLESLGAASFQTWSASLAVLDALGGLFAGERSIDELTGPVGIAQASGEAARSSGLDIVFLLFILSVNLAILNLLPLPVLDGGHVVLLTLEAFGVRVSQRGYEIAARVAIAFLLALMLIVTFNDIYRSVVGQDEPASNSLNTPSHFQEICK